MEMPQVSRAEAAPGLCAWGAGESDASLCSSGGAELCRCVLPQRYERALPDVGTGDCALPDYVSPSYDPAAIS